MSYLTCPNCSFTVSLTAAKSPFQNCPRCMLRDGKAHMMVAAPDAGRFKRRLVGLDRIAEAKARIKGPARGAGSA